MGEVAGQLVENEREGGYDAHAKVCAVNPLLMDFWASLFAASDVR